MNPVTSLPGWRWIPGMAYSGGVSGAYHRYSANIGEWMSGEAVIHLDDPATGGALLNLLGAEACRVWHSHMPPDAGTDRAWVADLSDHRTPRLTHHASLGRACFAVAVALGRWS